MHNSNSSARGRIITTAAYEPVDTHQEFTLSELEYVLYRLNNTAPGDDTVRFDQECTRLNDSASVLDAEMTAIRVALENASETRATITIRF